MTDRRDRDELTDRDDLAGIIHEHSSDVPHFNDAVEAADAAIAAGWVHWPHDCKREATPVPVRHTYHGWDGQAPCARCEANNAARQRGVTE